MSAPAHTFDRNHARLAGGGLPPGPAAMPFLGATGNLLRLFSNPIPYLDRLERRYGDVVALARGRSAYIAAFGAAHNRLILGNPALFHNLDATTMPVRVPADSALARLFNGLTHMNGPRHEQQRRLIAPAFSRRMVESYLADIAAEARRHVDGWRYGERRDIADAMSEVALSIAVKVLLGIDPAGAGDGIRRLFRQWVERVFSVSTMLLPFGIPGLPFRKLLALSEVLEAEVRSVIARKRAGSRSDCCALSALLNTRHQDEAALSDDELVGHTNFLFMAGHATTANALAWTLFLLERHPDLWDAVASECAEIDPDASPIEQLQKMKLLDAVARESIRLIPPVMLWCKISTAPFEIGGYHLPAGTRIFQSALMTQRDPTVFPQPDRFLPERWLTTNPDPFQFCAFSAGPRMCLGSTLAMMEIKIVIATIVRRFRLSLAPGNRIDVRGPMFLSPRNGIVMTIHPADTRPAQAKLRGNISALVDFPEPRAERRHVRAGR